MTTIQTRPSSKGSKSAPAKSGNGKSAGNGAAGNGSPGHGAAAHAALVPAVKKFISKPRKMLIDNQWVDALSGKTFPVFDPAAGSVVAHVAEGDAADVDRAA